MPKFRTAILTILCCLLFAISYAANPRTTYVPPFNITVEPAVLRKDQPVTVTAHLTAPGICTNHGGLVLRLYDIDDTTGEPTFNSNYLAQTSTADEFTAGSRVDLTFEPFNVPSKAGEKIYMVVWNWCEIRIPRGIDPETGTIIWETKLSGRFVGGATFHFACPSKTEVCGYRPD
jgi:hypothetical protein